MSTPSRSSHAAPEPTEIPSRSVSSEELADILAVWDSEQHNSLFDPKPTLTRIAELLEAETVTYLKQDPDPLDDRHPCRTHPSSTFGYLLKVLFRNEEFMNKLVVSYVLARDNLEMNVLGTRVLLDCVPGLDSSAVFSEPDDLVPQLFRWAESSNSDMLRAYSTGLLAAAMDVSEIASNYRAQNAVLIPVVLRRLKTLKKEADDRALEEEMTTNGNADDDVPETSGPFAHLKPETFPDGQPRPSLAEVLKQRNATEDHSSGSDNSRSSTLGQNGSLLIHRSMNGHMTRRSTLRVNLPASEQLPVIPESPLPNGEPPKKKQRLSEATKPFTSSFANSCSDFSNSSWSALQPLVIGHHSVYPLTPIMEQRLILQYLTPIGEYQDLLSFAFEHRSLELILRYIDLTKNTDVRLAFDALRYLASLLVHRKFALEFVAHSGVEYLVNVYQSSMASVGVATCIYYLAYNEDVMEKVCLLSDQVLDELVDYALWLVEHSYETGRASAAMFFTHAFPFRPILERFDQRDGLRRLFNYISTLTLLQEDTDETMLDDEHIYTSLQAIRNVCAAFRSYMVSHLYVKVEHLKRTQASRLQALPNITIPTAVPSNVPASKAMHLDSDSVRDGIWLLLHVLPMQLSWKPVDELRKLGAVRMLLFLIAESGEWTTQSKTEMVRNALEVLWIASVAPRVQLDLCDTVKVHRGIATEGIGILLETCESESDSEIELQTMALNVIINCVCAPFDRFGGGRLVLHQPTGTIATTSQTTETRMTSRHPSGNKKHKTHLDALDVLEKIWDAVRRNNGIMILKNLLHANMPITEADALRGVACRALNGLARSEVVRQILSKMPLLFSNELHSLMREPVLQDKRSEHNRFCEHARILIERVTQKPISDFPKDITQEKLWKAYVVAQTKILFNEKELLQLIHQHLKRKGLKQTAALLQQEAELPNVPASLVAARPTSIQPLPRVMDSLTGTSSPTDLHRSTLRLGGGMHSMIGGISAILRARDDERTTPTLPMITGTPTIQSTSRSSVSNPSVTLNESSQMPSMIDTEWIATPQISSASRRQSSTVGPHSAAIGVRQVNPLLGTPTRTIATPGRRVTKPALQTPLGKNMGLYDKAAQLKPHKSLDEIVTEYFRKQHAMCRNPVAACPQFSVFYPHHCPEPKWRRSAPTNLATRIAARPIYPPGGGYDGVRCDQKFVFSRFKPTRTFTEGEETFTCCNFSIDDEHLLLGTYAGDLHWYNVYTGTDESSTQCHNSSLSSIEQSKDGSLLLTSSAFVKPLSSLWKVGETQDHMFDFADEYFVEFSKWPQDRIIGTQGDKATVYDVETGRRVVQLWDETLSNHYTRNRATFHPFEELVLSDGILWDPRQPQAAIHKFDKLNAEISGIFHPRGLETIINTEVWDIRTYRLLRTVLALNQCKIVFSGRGDIFYGVLHTTGDDADDRFRQTFSSSFRTFDATDYEVITTINTKRTLFDLCADHSDAYMAVIETHSKTSDEFLSMEENVCRLYEVGKTRDLEDVDEQEDVNEEDGHDSDGSSSSSGSDDDDDEEDTSEEEENTEQPASDNSEEDEDEEEENNEAAVEEAMEDDGDENYEDVDEGDGRGALGSDDGDGHNDVDVEFLVEHSDDDGSSSDDEDDDDDDEDSDDDPDMDDTYDPDSDPNAPQEHPGSSSIVLNPTLRRQRRRGER